MPRYAACLLLVLGLSPPFLARGVAGQRQTTSAAQLEFFEQRIRPLLVRHCYECHSGDAKTLQGGLRLDHPEHIRHGGDSGPALVAGQPDESLLIEAVRYQSDALQMPPEGKLPDSEIAYLVQWIRRGAAWPAPLDSDPLVPRRIDFEAGRRFWSFQPLQIQALPPISTPQWPQRRIDQFILAAMQQRGLHPSARADRRTLIRRATFDLLGLPPTPQEVDRYLQDRSPDAYQRLVDRLLASPHYGERWGRFWLDHVRYSDTTAQWLKSTGQAYLYRDWVVRALNEDLPYDQFVRRQLATDLIPQTGPEDMPALGLLGLSPTYWKELKLDKEVIKTVVASEWEERIDMVSRTFLGLTVACARCHDHKFDPISTEDYYALAGVLASVRLADRPIIAEPLAQQAQQARERVRGLEEELKKLKDEEGPAEDAGQRMAELEALIAEIKSTTPHYHTPLAHAVEEASIEVLADGSNRTKIQYAPGQPRDVAVQIRGNPSKPGALVRRRFLEVFCPQGARPFQNGSGRLELADALLREAGPLTTRVLVNRVWARHFGRGLVDTPSNFGSQGSRPSHPKLLDDLAARFNRHGRSIKWLHREIMLSATYQQQSNGDQARQTIDPDNRWLWRMNRRRLNIEAWRDAMLAASGKLDRRLGGPAKDLSDLDNHRRTIYGKINRRDVNPMLRLHDFPDPTSHNPQRIPTTTPLQQLFVLNSPLMQDVAAELAGRVQAECDELADQVQLAYQLLYSRPATPRQLRLAADFLRDDARQTSQRWQQYAQVLLGTNEFLFID